jgi:hypothetical protein
VEASFARVVWRLIEPLHAVTYFAPEARDAAHSVGYRGFWMGYFANRSAPMGEVTPGVVTATFFNFHPAMVERAIPDAWALAPASVAIESRRTAASAALRRLVPDADALADQALTLLWPVIDEADGGGRPLFSANRELDDPDDEVAQLWQAVTALREHRGDGHVACLTAEGIGGCEAHVLAAAATGTPPELLREARGWSEAEWLEATVFWRSVGVLEGDRLTGRGAALRERVEARTDELAVVPYGELRDDERERLVELLVPATRTVLASGLVPFPNPMSLPRPDR